MNSELKTNKLSFCAITPDRGDRPEFLAHCKYQIEHQTVKPGDHFIIDYKPINNEPDLIPRIKSGLYKAKQAGYDIVFIIENDDYYPENYFEEMLKPFETFENLQAVGIYETIYYHIGTCKYHVHSHPERSSLFCTAFKLSALENFNWPKATEIFLDLALWEHFKDYTLLRLQNNIKPIGIKHGVGFCGGNGHNSNLNYYEMTDKDFRILSMLVRPESLKFYKEQSEKLQPVNN